MGVFLHRLKGRTNANWAVYGPIGRLSAFFRRIFDSEIEGAHTNFVSHEIHGAFNAERRHRRRGRSISRDLRPVHQHVMTHRLDVLQVVTGIGCHSAEHAPDTGESPVLVAQYGCSRRDRTVFLGANFDIHRC